MIPLDVHTQFNRLKSSAKKRNIEFLLTPHDLYLIDYPITCPILGIPLMYNKGQAQDNSYSIDRIDSNGPYSVDNIEVISLRANKLKSDATLNEMKLLYEYYINHTDD